MEGKRDDDGTTYQVIWVRKEGCSCKSNVDANAGEDSYEGEWPRPLSGFDVEEEATPEKHENGDDDRGCSFDVLTGGDRSQGGGSIKSGPSKVCKKDAQAAPAVANIRYKS